MSEKRILIVDDEEEFLALLKGAFEARGWTVFLAGDGDSALRALSETPVHVVLSDVRMPKLSGIGLATALHRLHRTGAEVFLMSAFADLSDSMLQGLGVREVFHKPFLFAAVVDRVENTLRNSA